MGLQKGLGGGYYERTSKGNGITICFDSYIVKPRAPTAIGQGQFESPEDREPDMRSLSSCWLGVLQP